MKLTLAEQAVYDRVLNKRRTIIGIANELCVQEVTIRKHLEGIYRKLGVHSREELIEKHTVMGDLSKRTQVMGVWF